MTRIQAPECSHRDWCRNYASKQSILKDKRIYANIIYKVFHTLLSEKDLCEIHRTVPRLDNKSHYANFDVHMRKQNIWIFPAKTYISGGWGR